MSNRRYRLLLPTLALAVLAASFMLATPGEQTSAQSTPTSYNLAERTEQVCDGLLLALRRANHASDPLPAITRPIYDATSGTYPWSNAARTTLIPGATAPSGGNTGVTAPVGMGCAGDGNSLWVLTSTLNELDFMGWDTRLDLSRKSIESLKADDFHALSKLGQLRLEHNMLTELPDGLFSQTRMRWLNLSNNRLTTLPKFNPISTAPTTDPRNTWRWSDWQSRLQISSNPITTLPDDVFDDSTFLRRIDFRYVPINTLNLRWFERLPLLGNSKRHGTNAWYGESQVRFDNMPLERYHYSVDGVVEPGSEVEYLYTSNSGTDAAAIALGAAIKARITAYAAATDGVTDEAYIEHGSEANINAIFTGAGVYTSPAHSANFWAPGIIYEYTCDDRSEAVEKEILTWIGNAPADDLGRGREHAIGNIADARWAKVPCSGTIGLPAGYRQLDSGEPLDDVQWADPPNTATVLRGMAPNTLIFDDSAIVDTNGALDPDDFENLVDIDTLIIRNAKISSIPAATFKHMTQLTDLRIENALLDEADLAGAGSFLQHFASLESLRLNGNLLTEFNASTHLPAAVRNTLKTLHLQDNPILETNLTGLDLTELRIDGTRITELDPAIKDMEALERVWWRNEFLANEGIGSTAFDDYPATLMVSHHTEQLGNPFYTDDAAIQADAVEMQLELAARMAAINAADPGNDLVTDRFLGDPCRPGIRTFETYAQWSASRDDFCLTRDQITDWVNSIDSFNGLESIRALGLDLSDSQAGTLLDNIDGKPIELIEIAGAGSAFGSGVADAKFNAFDSLGTLQHLIINGTDLTLDQAKLILTKLAAKYEADDSATAHDGLETLDLSYNPQLFAGATATSVATFLEGVTILRANQKSDLNLGLRDTGLTFPVLKGIIDSMGTDNVQQLRTLDVSQNPGLWTHADATDMAIEDLFESLKGTTSINVGDSGMTAAQAKEMFDALDDTSTPDIEIGTDGGGGKAVVRHALTRMAGISLEGIDLSDTTAINLNTDAFAKVSGKYGTSQGTLHTLNLSDTKIDFAGLQAVVAGLDAGDDQHEVITTLVLDNSGEIWKSIDTAGEFTALTDLFEKLTNLRTLSIRDSSLADPTPADPTTSASHFTFAHFEAILDGLDQADGGTTADDGANNMYLFDLRDNPQLFAPNPADTTATPPVAAETAEAHATRLAPVFAQASHAIMRITGTGLTEDQLSAIIAEKEELTAQLREGGVIRRSSTPPPRMAVAESARESIRIVFIHEPRAIISGGATITQTGYQYRYRPLPADANERWDEQWRTLTLDLSESGQKSFFIHNLRPETTYQVQLRASGGSAATGMTAASSPVLIRGGTMIELPILNSISPTITEVAVQSGETVRLEVDVFGISDIKDNTLATREGSDLIFRWVETSDNTGGTFAAPNHERRVIYTAPGLPGTYLVMAEAQPDGICFDHHVTEFGISDAERAPCQATFTVHVSRASDAAEEPAGPRNPDGLIPTSLTDIDGTAYAVFLPVEGGTFTGEGITVSAQPGAVPDQTFVGIAAATAGAVPDATAGSRMTLAGMFHDIMGVTRNGATPVTGYTFDDPISACLPLPPEYRTNVSDIVLVGERSDGSLGILSTKLRQTGGGLSVCGAVSTLPAKVAVAKLGVVAPPPPPPDTGDTGDELPDTGATAPANAWSLWALLIGAVMLLATTAYIARGRRTARHTS